MIIKIPSIPKEYEAIPYHINYNTDFIKNWKPIFKFAWLPRFLWWYEDKSSIMGNWGPDTFRVFVRESKIVWLESYYEFEAKPPHTTKNKKISFAVDKYWYLENLL